MNADDVLKRFRTAKKRKSNWSELYEEAQNYVAPHREAFDDETSVSPGQRKDGQGYVFDSTAVDSVQKFASNLQSSLVPPMRKWAQLNLGPQIKDNKANKEALAQAEDILFRHIHNSNFDTQIAESFQDLAIGTGALLCMKGTVDKPFRFINVPLSELYMLEGPFGTPDKAYRSWDIELQNIEKTWPDATLHKDLQERMAEKPDAKIKIVEEIFPDDVEITTPAGKEKVKGFRYSVVAVNGKHMLVEREQRSSPWVIFRWSTLPGEIYGRGPVLIALPDIKTLNKAKELMLQAASMEIFPMSFGDNDADVNWNTVKYRPATIIPASRRQGMPAPLEPYRTGISVDLTQFVIRDMQNSIKNMLFADPLGPIDLPVKSATEISMRQQELAKRIGSAFGRLQFELIQPLINRCLDILEELGLIDLSGLRVDGNALAIEHISPLAQAQAEEEVTAIMRYLEAMAGYYGPEALAMSVPPEKLTSALGPLLNIPQDLIPDEQEMEQRRNMLEQAAQAMEGAQ